MGDYGWAQAWRVLHFRPLLGGRQQVRQVFSLLRGEPLREGLPIWSRTTGKGWKEGGQVEGEWKGSGGEGGDWPGWFWKARNYLVDELYVHVYQASAKWWRKRTGWWSRTGQEGYPASELITEATSLLKSLRSMKTFRLKQINVAGNEEEQELALLDGGGWHDQKTGKIAADHGGVGPWMYDIVQTSGF